MTVAALYVGALAGWALAQPRRRAPKRTGRPVLHIAPPRFDPPPPLPRMVIEEAYRAGQRGKRF